MKKLKNLRKRLKPLNYNLIGKQILITTYIHDNSNHKLIYLSHLYKEGTPSF